MGKTTLAEALLHRAGAITRRGRVEDGTTACDFQPEEHQRGMSLSLSVAPFEWRGATTRSTSSTARASPT